MTLDDVAARTRIKPAMLEALELGAFERLPGEFFTRAFLRTYARELGVPEPEVLAEYDRGRAAPTGEDDTVAYAHRAATATDSKWQVPAGLGAARSLAAAAVVIAIAAAAWNALSGGGPPDRAAAEHAAVAATGIRTPAPVATTPAPASGVPAPAAAASTSGGTSGLSIEIRPRRTVWVTATADGTRVLFRALEAGERVRIHGRQELTFRVGDAEAFDFVLNGTQARPVGRPGEVVTLRITPENYQRYLVASR